MYSLADSDSGMPCNMIPKSVIKSFIQNCCNATREIEMKVLQKEIKKQKHNKILSP
jgi:hypothetical protein